LPGTDLYDETSADFISDEPELFDCYHTLLPTRLSLDRFYARMADLLEMAGGRTGVGVNRPGDASVFYYSDSDAFGQMIAAVRRGRGAPLNPPPRTQPRGRFVRPQPRTAAPPARTTTADITHRPNSHAPASPEPARRSP